MLSYLHRRHFHAIIIGFFAFFCGLALGVKSIEKSNPVIENGQQ